MNLSDCLLRLKIANTYFTASDKMEDRRMAGCLYPAIAELERLIAWLPNEMALSELKPLAMGDTFARYELPDMHGRRILVEWIWTGKGDSKSPQGEWVRSDSERGETIRNRMAQT